MLCLLVSAAFSQSDSTKAYFVNGQKVFLGKFYKLELSGKAPEYGKLVAVNKNSILIHYDNILTEYETEDIESMKETEGIIQNYSNYTKRPPGVKYKPMYSLSAGYSQKYSEDNNSNYYYYSDDYISFDGFNLQGDMMFQTSDYFGFRVDLNYIHTFGARSEGEPYTNTYDSTTYYSVMEYSDLNLITLKSGILFGSISRENIVSFYLYLGLGLGYTFGNDDIDYEYKTKNNITTVYPYHYKSYNEFTVGAHTSIRLSFKLSKNYSLFLEPSFQYWSNNIETIINLNSGVIFHL
jgi:hypothetical protein